MQLPKTAPRAVCYTPEFSIQKGCLGPHPRGLVSEKPEGFPAQLQGECESQGPKEYIVHGCCSTLLHENLTEVKGCSARVDLSKRQGFLKLHWCPQLDSITAGKERHFLIKPLCFRAWLRAGSAMTKTSLCVVWVVFLFQLFRWYCQAPSCLDRLYGDQFTCFGFRPFRPMLMREEQAGVLHDRWA